MEKKCILSGSVDNAVPISIEIGTPPSTLAKDFAKLFSLQEKRFATSTNVMKQTSVHKHSFDGGKQTREPSFADLS